MENDSKNKSTSYTVIDYSSNDKKNKTNNFGKSFFIPFCSGVLGATLVIGTCFGVPNIRDKVIGNIEKPSNASVSQSKTMDYSGTLKEVSLSNFSDTGISVAEKVRPSIVGIQVNYSVNSIFSPSRNSNS